MTHINEDLKIRFCIPPLGTSIILAEDWTFSLYHERRNELLAKGLGIAQRYGYCTKWPEGSQYGKSTYKITAPAGTELKVSRIYIRQGLENFDSVTFTCKKGNSPNKDFHGRFWEKLADVNRIVCYPIGTEKTQLDMERLSIIVPYVDQSMMDRFAMMAK